MNSQLIPVFSGLIDHCPVQICNARDLHAFLEVGRDFSNWMKDRIERFELVEDEDYMTQVIDFPCSPNLASRDSNLIAGSNRIDYLLPLDVAKELAMAENNPRGRQVRRYFIQAEKELRELQRLPFSKRYQLQSRMLSLMKLIKVEKNPAHRAVFHAVMVDVGRQLGAHVPDLEKFETGEVQYRRNPDVSLTRVK